MKMYFAGVKRKSLGDLAPDSPVLVSFAEADERKVARENRDRDLVLDSGAFAAWRRDKPIALCEYLDFLPQVPKLTACVALDVIQGSAEAQLLNLRGMQEAGLGIPVWPVFHEGDDPELLAEYLRLGYTKICLGGTVNRGRPAIIDWLWQVFNRFPPGPQLKYHGLAMTQSEILYTMQGWLDSVDSTTWLTFAKYGVKDNLHMFNGAEAGFLRQIGRLCMEHKIAQGAKIAVIAQAEQLELDLFSVTEPQADPAGAFFGLDWDTYKARYVRPLEDMEPEAIEDFEEWCQSAGVPADEEQWAWWWTRWGLADEDTVYDADDF